MIGSKRDYFFRLITITLVFYLTVFLSGKYGLNTAFLVANTLSLVITPVVWKYDGILKLDVKWKYIGYYLVLLLLSLQVFPRDLYTISKVLYRQGFREEVLYRFFMNGIFLKYGYNEDAKEQQKCLLAVFVSGSYNT